METKMQTPAVVPVAASMTKGWVRATDGAIIMVIPTVWNTTKALFAFWWYYKLTKRPKRMKFVGKLRLKFTQQTKAIIVISTITLQDLNKIRYSAIQVLTCQGLIKSESTERRIPAVPIYNTSETTYQKLLFTYTKVINNTTRKVKKSCTDNMVYTLWTKRFRIFTELKVSVKIPMSPYSR